MELVHPLLCLTADETREWCRAAGLQPRQDSTNDDRAIRRNLIRHEVLPALGRVHEGAEVNLARSAELLAELDELVDELVEPHLQAELDLDRLAELPRGLRVLVLRAAAERAAGRPLRLPRELTGRLEAVAGRRLATSACRWPATWRRCACGEPSVSGHRRGILRANERRSQADRP